MGENLKAEKGAFTFSQDKIGEVIREHPLCIAPISLQRLQTLLNITRGKHKKICRCMHSDSHVHILALLVVSNGMKVLSPADGLWVKLGGNKGHGSFKFNFRIPNSQKKKKAPPQFLKPVTGLPTFIQPWICIKNT